jgi:hypothetical protein
MEQVAAKRLSFFLNGRMSAILSNTLTAARIKRISGFPLSGLRIILVTLFAKTFLIRLRI